MKNLGGRPADPSTNTDRRYRTIEGLKKHPLWHQLSIKQRNFLTAYIETLDRVKAVRAAFEFATDEAADLHASRLLNQYAIKQLLAAYYGYELLGEPLKKLEFLQLISDRLRNPHTKTSEFVVLARIASELMALKPLPRTKHPELTVDDLVQTIEKNRKSGENKS